MQFNSFIDVINDIGVFSSKELQALIDKLQKISIEKNKPLLRYNDICQSLFFLNKGSLRQYYISDKGEETTVNLFIEKDWVFDYESFTGQKSMWSTILAYESSEVFALNIFDLHELIKESNSFFQIARIFQSAVDFQYRSQMISPDEKYSWLLANKPQLIQRFPLKFIASYLNITPETLSRVRKKLSARTTYPLLKANI